MSDKDEDHHEMWQIVLRGYSLKELTLGFSKFITSYKWNYMPAPAKFMEYLIAGP